MLVSVLNLFFFLSSLILDLTWLVGRSQAYNLFEIENDVGKKQGCSTKTNIEPKIEDQHGSAAFISCTSDIITVRLKF